MVAVCEVERGEKVKTRQICLGSVNLGVRDDRQQRGWGPAHPGGSCVE